jgi:hypothetical protein
MGMFDYYEPVPPIACPHCGAVLRDWQGKQGPCGLLAWRQGHSKPVGGPDPEPGQESNTTWLERFSLPDSFEFYSFCECNHQTLARGTTESGVWSHSEVTCILDLASLRK